MVKVAIKSEKFSPFGGIFSIMEQFDSKEQTLHSHQARCDTFLTSAIRPISLSHTSSSKVPYIALQPPK